MHVLHKLTFSSAHALHVGVQSLGCSLLPGVGNCSGVPSRWSDGCTQSQAAPSWEQSDWDRSQDGAAAVYHPTQKATDSGWHMCVYIHTLPPYTHAYITWCVYSMIHFLYIHKHLLLQVHNTILTHICTYVPIHTCVYIASQTFRNKQIMFYACIYVHMSILSLLNMVLRIVKGYQLCE